jgi:MFS family permease
VGLTAALLIAVAGAAGVVAAGVLGSFTLLCASSVAFGAGNTAVMLARYAAADLAAPAERGRAIGRVVLAATVGGVAGPNLLAPAGAAAAALGLPRLTGLYLFAAAAFAFAAMVMFAWLRPDPLVVARELDGTARVRDGLPPASMPLRELLAPTGAITGLATVVVANFVMVAVMVMAPVHMQGHGHGLEAVGLVVSLHIAGMFAPSPVTGWLTDRVGAVPVAAGGAVLLLGAGLLAAAAGHHAGPFALGLLLLGVGWNAALIAGSALLASAVPVSQRPRVEGVGELGMGVAAATATGLAGPVVGIAGYAALALAGAAAGAALTAFLLTAGRRGAPEAAAPAGRLLG